MRETDVRSLSWIFTTLACLPVLVLVLRGYTGLVQVSGLVLPDWLNAVITLALFGGIYVGAGYLVAWGLNKRYPDSPAGTIPDPTRSGRE